MIPESKAAKDKISQAVKGIVPVQTSGRKPVVSTPLVVIEEKPKSKPADPTQPQRHWGQPAKTPLRSNLDPGIVKKPVPNGLHQRQPSGAGLQQKRPSSGQAITANQRAEANKKAEYQKKMNDMKPKPTAQALRHAASEPVNDPKPIKVEKKVPEKKISQAAAPGNAFVVYSGRGHEQGIQQVAAPRVKT